VMVATAAVGVVDDLRRQREAEPPGDPCEIGVAPAVTQQERHRDGPRQLRGPEAMGRADDLVEEIVGVEFVDEHRHQGTRPREMPRTRRQQPHRPRTELATPVLGIDVVSHTCGRIELPHDCETRLTGRAHGCTSSETPGAGAWQEVGWPGAAPVLGGNAEGHAGMCPHGDNQGQWTVVRRRLAARSSVKRPSCQGVR
jgi:hypothetical protein